MSIGQTQEIVCDCGKKYKTKGGHKATKRAENEREIATFIISTLVEIVDSAVEKIKERKVFNASIMNEMTGFRFELKEGSQEFSLLKTIYESLVKKGDAVKVLFQFFWRCSCKCHQILQRTYMKCSSITGNKGGRQYDTILQAREANCYKQCNS